MKFDKLILKPVRCLSVKYQDLTPGFTLVEIAIILVIIGLLVGMGAGLVGPLTKRMKRMDTRDVVKEVYNTVIGYTVANKTLPSALTALSIKTQDPYNNNLLYYAASGITGSDICTTQGTYLTVNDKGTNNTNVAFIVFSQGENICNQTGTASPFTISDEAVTVACPQDANAGYDDIVMYQDVNYLREKICNTFRIVTESLPVGTEEFAYPSTTLQATDGTSPYAWSITGTTQGTNGCSGTDYPIDSSSTTGICMTTTGSISGTPVLDGVFSFTVNVTDVEGRTASHSLSTTVNPNNPAILTLFLHKGTVSSPYSATLSGSGGTGSYTWIIASGSLPPGLSLGSNSISGTPTTAGTYSFTVQITDGRGRTATKTLSIAVEDSGGSGGGGSGGSGGSSLLWIGQKGGDLQSCDSSGSCTDHGSKGDDIKTVTAFSGGLWLGQKDGHIQSCDSSGSCTDHGSKGDEIKSMSEFSSSLWIGLKNGHLKSCDSSGSCTDHGNKGDDIEAMAEFDGSLWIGLKNDHLLSCDSSGSCTDHGNKGDEIKSMSEFSSSLWIGLKDGHLKSCDSSGSCTDNGDQGDRIEASAIF